MNLNDPSETFDVCAEADSQVWNEVHFLLLEQNSVHHKLRQH